MTNRQEIILGLLTFLMVGLLAPLIIGIIMSIESIKILAHKDDYKSGTLVVDSMSGRLLGDSQNSESIAYGFADSTYTGISVGDEDDPFGSKINAAYSRGERPQIAIWYKPDGETSLIRTPDEKEFPTWRVSKKLLMFIGGFMGPFLFLFILRKRLKKKWYTPNTEHYF